MAGERPALSSDGGKTPADLALEKDGGEIIPDEFRPKPLPLASPPGASAAPVDVPGAEQVSGDPAPKPPPESAEQIAWKGRLSGHINLELNVLNSCARSVRNLINQLVAEQPADSADIAEGQWGAGKRTPLEEKEPDIVLEVYRHVRRRMDEEERRKREDELEALKELLKRAGLAK